MLKVLNDIWALKWYEIIGVAIIDDLFIVVRVIIPFIVIMIIIILVICLMHFLINE